MMSMEIFGSGPAPLQNRGQRRIRASRLPGAAPEGPKPGLAEVQSNIALQAPSGRRVWVAYPAGSGQPGWFSPPPHAQLTMRANHDL